MINALNSTMPPDTPAHLPKNIVVCVKQIPDMVEMSFDHEKKVLIRDGVRNILNPFDRRAIAEAVKIKAKNGGEITAITMGPAQAREALYECLAAGADKAVHLLDQAFAGADTLATARALAAAIKRLPCDLILCGKYSVDAETGQVGPEVAELLDIPHVTGVCSLTFDENPGYFIAERETDEGFETIECEFPALITAAERLVKPLKIKQPDIEAVKHRSIEVITAAELSLDPSIVGQSGSPTWVSEIFTLEKNRQVEFLEGDTQQIAQTLVERLCNRGLFGGWEELEPSTNALLDQPTEVMEGRTILTVAELMGSRLRGVSLELLGKGVELARKLQGKLVAVLIGESVSDHARELAAHGADKSYLIEGERFAQYNPYDFTAVLTRLIKQLQPFAVLIPSTANGRDYAPRVAARLGLGLTADCVGLELNERNEFIQLKPAFGGQIVASILSRTWPQMATVRPGMLAKLEPNHQRSCVIEHIEEPPAANNYYRVLASSHAAGPAAAELDDTEIVICVGMGIGGPENLPIIEPLASLLGAAVGATRRVVDQGWFPRQQQIGITGRAVAPKLYIGVGVRGAFNHTIGIHRSGIIVAINTDQQADIFQVADYGIVADFAELVPALIAALDRRKTRLVSANGD
ncbi:MAG TPA: FAD-binding protein [Pyrinomonadaceae bacterium]|nr:FAD-binding protein [Pyrinomonadaceae bacterium]